MRRIINRILALLLAALMLPVTAVGAAGADLTENIRTARELFGVFRDCEMLAASGAGAWEGRLRIGYDGTFSGSYCDADDMNIYQVDFSGRFGEVYKLGDNEYQLVVYAAATEKEPGTTERGGTGEIIHYTDTIMPRGSIWTLTLPGVAQDRIPEDVRGEIGGVYDVWEDYSKFITLTDRNGWGFFMEEPSEWNKTLFRRNASEYSNDLALAAAQLSQAAEKSTSVDDIRRQFNRYDIGEHDFQNYDKLPRNIIDDWNNFWGAAHAFSIGQSRFTDFDGSDLTVLVVVGRGTQITRPAEWTGDVTHGFIGKDLLGQKVWKDIYDYEEQIWNEFKNYLTEHPVTTPRVKVLVTGHSLGGAAANLFGARLTKEYGTISGLEGKLGKEDIYVYTFGAIRVLTQKENVEEGYENIHNIYNFYDSFGENGNQFVLGVGMSGAKFGHTDLFGQPEKEGFNFLVIPTTYSHNIEAYIEALENYAVYCSLPGAPSPIPESEEWWEREYIRDGRDYSPIWVRKWKGVTNPENTIEINTSYYGKDEVTVSLRFPGRWVVCNAKMTGNAVLDFGSPKDVIYGTLVFFPQDGGRIEARLYSDQLAPDDPCRTFMSELPVDDMDAAEPKNIQVYVPEDDMTDIIPLYEWEDGDGLADGSPDETWDRPVTVEDWIGSRVSSDLSNAELIITPNEDGRLHMTVVFFRNMRFDATLYATSSDLIWFETDNWELEGTMELKPNGSVVFSAQGGDMLDPELEFGDFFALNTFLFEPADPASLWFYDSSDASASDEDWLGEWEMAGGDYESRLNITRNGESLHGEISFDGMYFYSGTLEKIDEENMDFLSEGFGGLLTLNRKHRMVRMTECYAEEDAVNDWLDFFHYMVEYGPAGTDGAWEPEEEVLPLIP